MTSDTPGEARLPDPELPRAVALAWGVAAHPQRGPKRELSIERIVDAAIEIADAEGLAAVSMSRVAASLGFTTMSLYRYVTSKDDLILLMQERAVDAIAPDDDVERDWREGVTAWVKALRGAYAEHPWVVDIPISGPPITPNSLAMVDWFLREVRSLPLSDGEKMSTLLLLTSYARATSAQDRDLAAAAAAAANPTEVTGEDFFAALAEFVTPERFPDLAPLFAAGGYIAAPGQDGGDLDDDFTFGLERILDGLEHHIARLETGEPPRTTEPPAALDHPRDKAVREAARARREAERALREARKREREAIKLALEREERARERAERAERKG